MEKRYQVFVSSTFTDLENEREAAFQLLMKMNCIPAGMELFPAADEEQMAFIRKVIDDSDYYVLIIGGRYGSRTIDGISYTESEYDYAVGKGLKVIALLHGDLASIPIGKSDGSDQGKEKLMQFREKVSNGRLVKTWTNTSELVQEMLLSLTHAFTVYPGAGWVRGGSSSNPELLEQLNAVRQANDDLRKRLTEQSTNVEGFLTIDIANGDEEFEMNGRTDEWEAGKKYTSYWKKSLSWNVIMGIIGPHILLGAAEVSLRAGIGNLVMSYLSKIDSTEATMSEPSFTTIKIQLLALGYIEVFAAKVGDGSTHQFWRPTSNGKQVMAAIRTVKSKRTQEEQKS